MKRIFTILLSCVMALTLVSCANNNSDGPQTTESVTDKEMTLTLSFGERSGTFTGTLENGLPNGEGTFTYKNPAGTELTYTGEFKSGHFDGKGKTVWETGQTQEGEFENDFLVNGTMYADDGTLIYKGEFQNGEAPPLTEDEVTIALLDPDSYKYRKVVDLLVNLKRVDKTEGLDAYIIVGGAGDLNAFFVSFASEVEGFASVGDYILVTGTIVQKIVAEDGTTAMLLQDVERSDIELPHKPEIGMTEKEVIISTWGYPQKKNTTTTANSVREQWVYDKGYIYFDDGYVTAIQEKS